MAAEYLGDSVYVEHDGFAYVLSTRNGYPDDPRNVIVLEPEVLRSLMRYVEATTRSAPNLPAHGA